MRTDSKTSRARHLNDLAAVVVGGGDAVAPAVQPQPPARQSLTKTRPALLTTPPPQHGDFWTCPKTGIVIPKTLKGNLEWRQRILGEAKLSEPLQRGAAGRLRRVGVGLDQPVRLDLPAEDTSARTGERSRAIGHDAHLPFVTWRIQDEFIGELVRRDRQRAGTC
jgi:hypothetical protein